MPNRKLISRGSKRQSKKTNNAVLRYALVFVTSLILLPLIYIFRIFQLHGILPPSPVQERLQSQRFAANASAKSSSMEKSQKSAHSGKDRRLVLTAYLEPPDTLTVTASGLFHRKTSADRLQRVTFPDVQDCDTLMQDFPVDAYPVSDPFLPWIHDYFPSVDGKFIQFVAQNRRRCDTGIEELETMKFWEPQVSLFQGVPVVVTKAKEGPTKYRLASSYEEATHNATRFQCRFHTHATTVTTLSVYPFDYEYITWRKGKGMFDRRGNDIAMFWLSQLLFSCPVPDEFQTMLYARSTDEIDGAAGQPVLHMDLIPIRTPPRDRPLLTRDQIGPAFLSTPLYDLEKSFGRDQSLPNIDDAGRWQNLPICRRRDASPLPSKSPPQSQQKFGEDLKRPTLPDHPRKKPFRLVACTWTSSSYTRRGDAVRVSDSAKRLKEWISFHLMVGVDHVFVYDNSRANEGVSDLRKVAESFGRDLLTYHVWPAKICNNNRPAHKNPGERSSQYGAESSCRTRYGELTDWMTFLDTDEYMVPMKLNNVGEYNWHPVLDDMEAQNISIMKFLSSRGKPRIELTEELDDQSVCMDPVKVKGPIEETEPCVGPMRNKTFLQVYNCDYIRPPKPRRFDRAMKQIYRPSFVLSHFVHYSTVTSDMDLAYTEYKALHNGKEPIMDIHDKRWEKQAPEMFMNELTEGALIHARSVLPHETRRRSSECFSGSKFTCMMGFLCGDNVKFVDELHKQNVFRNSDGNFCNCWKNNVVEEALVPKLEKLLLLAE